MVFLIVIFISRFHIVVMLIKRLPILLIPEKLPIPAMGNDVIHHSGFCKPAFSFTDHAEGMSLQKTLTGLLPCPPISTLCSRPHILRMEGLMRFTVFCAIGNELRTSGMMAGCFGSTWHFIHLPLRYLPKKKAPAISGRCLIT